MFYVLLFKLNYLLLPTRQAIPQPIITMNNRKARIPTYVLILKDSDYNNRDTSPAIFKQGSGSCYQYNH